MSKNSFDEIIRRSLEMLRIGVKFSGQEIC